MIVPQLGRRDVTRGNVSLSPLGENVGVADKRGFIFCHSEAQPKNLNLLIIRFFLSAYPPVSVDKFRVLIYIE